MSKIVSNTAGFADMHSEQSFQDVPTDGAFYQWIERLASRSVISGYECGGSGESCQAGNLPYFRPNADITLGQSVKIVYGVWPEGNNPVEAALSKH